MTQRNRKTIKEIANEGLTEQIWKDFERRQLFKERVRRIRVGRIVPPHRCRPQMMYKDSNGRWCPELAIH